jgi:hypothetical protein
VAGVAGLALIGQKMYHVRAFRIQLVLSIDNFRNSTGELQPSTHTTASIPLLLRFQLLSSQLFEQCGSILSLQNASTIALSKFSCRCLLSFSSPSIHHTSLPRHTRLLTIIMSSGNKTTATILRMA